MRYNPSTYGLVRRAIVEARIRKWFKRKKKKDPSPSKLLTMLLRPKKGIHIKLDQYERMEFVGLVREMYKTRKIISKYREKYGRRPRIFYRKVFGFPPRKVQSVKVIWEPFNIHFIFKKNDLIAFWRKVQWGPGSAGFYPVGDTDIKIKDLRGLVSFGREEKWFVETRDLVRHESVHAFEGRIKKTSYPAEDKVFMFNSIKSELNAYLHNMRYSRRLRKRRINEWARGGLGEEAKDFIEDYLRYQETLKRIRKLKKMKRRAKTKKEKRILNTKLEKLKERLEQKRRKKRMYICYFVRTVNQIKKALEVMPIEMLHRIIYETPYERLCKKIPEAVKVYLKMKYEWYNHE